MPRCPNPSVHLIAIFKLRYIPNGPKVVLFFELWEIPISGSSKYGLRLHVKLFSIISTEIANMKALLLDKQREEYKVQMGRRYPGPQLLFWLY